MKRLILAAALLVGCSQDAPERRTITAPMSTCPHDCDSWYRYALRVERHRHRDQLRNCSNDPDPVGCLTWEMRYHDSLLREYEINYQFCIGACVPTEE